MHNLVAFQVLGLPLVAWGGIIVFLVLVTQILVGKRVIKINFKYHNTLAWLLLALASLHALAAFIYIFGK